jgi:hypothetical protein
MTETTTTYTRAQLSQVIGLVLGQMEQVTDTGPADTVVSLAWALLDRSAPEGPYTRDQVSAALNDAANACDDGAGYEDSHTIWQQDVRNLAVNAIGYQLDHPGTSLRNAIEENYGTDADEVLGWVS